MFFTLLPSKYKSINLADVLFAILSGAIFVALFFVFIWLKDGLEQANSLVGIVYFMFVVSVLSACFFINSDGQFGPEK